MNPLILNASRLHQAKELPLALAGQPAEINGVPVHYFEKEIARAGHWVKRGVKNPDGTHEEFDITPDRIETWVQNFKARQENGVKTFVPGEHRTAFNAADNHGYVIDLKRKGGSAYATLQLVGEKALELAAKNDVSIYITHGSVDAYGNKYTEALEHLALTPNPNQPNLEPFVRIAASADAPARDVPVFELSAASPTSAPSRKGFRMKPENAQQVRAKLGFGADVPDDQLDDKAAEKALALSADIATLTTERDTLKTERDAAKAEATANADKVLSLSGDAEEPGPLSLSLINKAFKTEREAVIAAGVISPAGMEELDKLFYAGGKPTRVALSLSAGSTDPMYSRVCEILKKFPGVKTGNAVHRGVVPAERLELSGDPAEKATLEEVNKGRAFHSLPPLAKLTA